MNYQLAKWIILGACSLVGVVSEAKGQVYYYSPGVRISTPQQRVNVGNSAQVFRNDRIQQRAFRPEYQSTPLRTNNGHYGYPQRAPYQVPRTYYVQPGTTYYNSVPPSRTILNGNTIYTNPPSQVVGDYYGPGFYRTPQQAANANVGAVIGGTIGGQRGAQFGATIGGSIRP